MCRITLPCVLRFTAALFVANVVGAQVPAEKIVGGSSHAVGLDTLGAVYAWGGNDSGQLGQGDTTPSSVPLLVTLPGPAVDVAAGGSHTLCLLADGSVWAFGANSKGQLGIGSFSAQSTPQLVTGLGPSTDIEAGASHSTAIAATGTLFSWGNNDRGQLGLGHTNSMTTPQSVALPQPVAKVSGGADHTLAALVDGTVWSWGRNLYGMLGLGYQGGIVTSPQQVPGLSSVTSVGAGYYHSIVLRSNGEVWAWGFNSQGQIGQGIFGAPHFYSPVQVMLPSTAVSVDVGVACSFALLGDGSLLAWGQNAEGELGIGSTDNQHTPTPVASLPEGVTWIDADGFRITYAGTADSDAYGWGRNESGQLGLGFSTALETLPQPIEFFGCGFPMDYCECMADTYCITTPNSTGLFARISSDGIPSLSLDAFSLTANGLPPSQFGVFFFGPLQVQIQFGDGYRCVGGPLTRLDPPVQFDENGLVQRLLDFTQSPLDGFLAGDTINFQLWYRDPQPVGTGFNLTNALEVTLCP